MLNNYHYFIVLAEELNISRAAKRLYISHQCLSKYLKNLEQEYGVTFFERNPQLALTAAGRAYLETLHKIRFLEQNLDSQLQDIRLSKKGLIRLGTTEGRYRILIPDILARFKVMYPEVELDVQYTTSAQLSDRILKNELDLVLLNKSDVSHNQLEVRPLLNEQLFIVISDSMLASYFPQNYPQCKETFLNGVDLAQFQEIPFVLNQRGFNSREVLETYMCAREIHLTCVMELTQLDLHFMLSARNYAASFCWSMYIPTIQKMNQDRSLSRLNIFPIKGLNATNQVVLVAPKGKILPEYGRALVRLIRQFCSEYSRIRLDRI